MTREEYVEQNFTTPLISDEWSEPKYECPKCKGDMRKNNHLAIVLATYPPQYRYTYRCDKCGYTEELSC